MFWDKIAVIYEPMETIYNSKANEAAGNYVASLANKIGANFRRQFTTESYKQFYLDRGFDLVDFYVGEGRMSCGIAVLAV